MRLAAAASRVVAPVLAGPARRADWLGVTPCALYLRTGGQPGVLAILTYDALRLPCGVRLPVSSTEVPLDQLVHRQQPCLVGDGAVVWDGQAGSVVITVVRQWTPCRPPRRPAVAVNAHQVRDGLPAPAAIGLDRDLLADLARPGSDSGDRSVVDRLLGRGPGLTPSGDDVLAGFLIGAEAFGFDAGGVCRAVADFAPARTTTLSSGLLWHASRGECIDEVAALAAAISGRQSPGPALRRLFAVGHTSGVALAWGLQAAAVRAMAMNRPSRSGAAA